MYVLKERCEEHIKYEERRLVDFRLDDAPAVVLGADFVPAFAPVVECQSHLFV